MNDQRPSSNFLSAENLARDFGIRSPLSKECLVQLYETILEEETAFQGWHQVFHRLWGSAEERLEKPLRAIMRKIGLREPGRPLHLLFALQTHYAILLDLLVKRFENLRKYEIIEPVFSWHLRVDNNKLHSTKCQMKEKLENLDLPSNFNDVSDLLKELHHSLFPRALRHHLGEYYTPDWLAEHLLDQLEFKGHPDGRLLDPACGSGTFLMAAIRRIRALPSPALPCLDQIIKNVVGIDLNPLAVMAAKANYLVAVHDLISPGDELRELPIYLADSILAEESRGEFDYIVGNPPWIAWDNLPDEYREATKPLWEKYGLFSLSGNAARHGGGKKDLSMLMLYATADRYLKLGGRLGMVITQTLFQTKGAGDGFRRFRLGENGESLKVLRVDDLTAIKPFDAANWTSTVVLEKGAATAYPVTYVRWKVGQIFNLSSDAKGQITNLSYGTRQIKNLSYEKIACSASPIDPRRPTSPWLIQPAGITTNGHLMPTASPADYEAHLGANSGGANGVYWVEVLGEAEGGVRIRNVIEKCKKPIPQVEQVIEPDLLYPLLRWSDLARYSPLPRYHLLLVQDCQRRVGLEESVLQNRYPLTYAYLRQFEALLTSRAAYRRYQGGQPFYSMYNVGPYTTAEYKVVWRRMDNRLTAAVAEPVDHPLLGRRPVVPQETCVLIACRSAEECHYLCALLNSEPAGGLLESHSVRQGKGFGTPSIMDYLPLRRFEPENHLHQELAACSREAHRLTHEGESPESIQQQIDCLARKAFAITK